MLTCENVFMLSLCAVKAEYQWTGQYIHCIAHCVPNWHIAKVLERCLNNFEDNFYVGRATNSVNNFFSGNEKKHTSLCFENVANFCHFISFSLSCFNVCQKNKPQQHCLQSKCMQLCVAID